ncbi:MAG: peptidoglycan-associated lipoprotein Pal [Caldimicrobium sp.]
MKTKLIVIIYSIFILIGCAKKEVPPLVDKPKEVIPQVEKKREEITTVIPKKEESKDLAQILGEEKGIIESTKEDRGKWKLYGRSTPPLYAIFFDFDDYSIRADMWDRIRENVKFLLERPNLVVELQGNCDERGTNEYNYALGMKRALAVKNVLIKLGIDENRIQVISFGEEKPLCKESDESCWAINRRVDFVIK